MTYEKQCQFGREIAALEFAACAATGNYPKLISSIREMASHRNGVSVGFLQAIAEAATQNKMQKKEMSV